MTAEYTASIGNLVNNPHILWNDIGATGTWSTGNGTEIEPAALLATGTTFDPWIAAPAFNAASAEVVFSEAQSFTCIAIAAHNIGTAGGTVVPQYSLDSGATWNSVGAATSPADDQAIMWLFSGEPAATHWRISVFALGSVNPEVGVAFMGDPTVIPQRIFQGYAPPTTPNTVALQSNVSEGNHLLGSAEIRQGSVVSASLTDITQAFTYSNDWLGFQTHFNAGGGFFWAWRPQTYQNVYYAWRNGAAIAPNNSGPAAFQSFDLDMRFHHDP